MLPDYMTNPASYYSTAIRLQKRRLNFLSAIQTRGGLIVPLCQNQATHIAWMFLPCFMRRELRRIRKDTMFSLFPLHLKKLFGTKSRFVWQNRKGVFIAEASFLFESQMGTEHKPADSKI